MKLFDDDLDSDDNPEENYSPVCSDNELCDDGILNAFVNRITKN